MYEKHIYGVDSLYMQKIRNKKYLKQNIYMTVHHHITSHHIMLCLVLSFILPAVVYSLELNGVTKPLGYFDPLGFSTGKSVSQRLWLREAELKHGRWAMLSATAIPVMESVSHTPGIHSLDNTTPEIQTAFMTLVAASEFQSMLNGWNTPFKNTNEIFTIKDDYNPGDFELKVSKTFKNKDADFMSNAELNHGRLAMIGSLGMIAQELVTNQPLF